MGVSFPCQTDRFSPLFAAQQEQLEFPPEQTLADVD